jgi:hypothetical protein
MIFRRKAKKRGIVSRLKRAAILGKAMKEGEKLGKREIVIDLLLDKDEIESLQKDGYRLRLTGKGWKISWS